MQISLNLTLATPQTVAPFGCLIAPGKPDFECDRFAWYENLLTITLGQAEFGLVCPKGDSGFHQPVLERHLHTEEVLVPLKEDVFLVLASANAFDGEIDPAHFAALYLRAGQGIALKAGVWHEAPKTFAREAPTLVIYRAETGARDKELLQMADVGLEVVVAGLSASL